MTGSLGPTSTYATPSPRTSLSKFNRLPSTTRSLTPLTAQCRAHGTRREHRMPSKPLAALCYARHSPGLTPLAARSAAHARARRGACTRSLTPRRRAGARQHGRGLPLARAPARTSCSLHGACPRRLLPASSPVPPPATSFQPGAAAALQDIAARFQSGAARRCPPPPPPPTPPTSWTVASSGKRPRAFRIIESL